VDVTFLLFGSMLASTIAIVLGSLLRRDGSVGDERSTGP
jgi:hypothetical protein